MYLNDLCKYDAMYIGMKIILYIIFWVYTGNVVAILFSLNGNSQSCWFINCVLVYVHVSPEFVIKNILFIVKYWFLCFSLYMHLIKSFSHSLVKSANDEDFYDVSWSVQVVIFILRICIQSLNSNMTSFI